MSKKKKRFRNFPAIEVIEGAAILAGLELRNCGKGHWQLRGGKFLVNFWPATGTIHVDGTCVGLRANRRDPVSDLIEMATTPPKMKRTGKAERPDPRKMKKVRLELWRKTPFCHWCKRVLAFRESTVDHVIPLARGGTNHVKNLVIACQECNLRRGHDMPEMATEGEMA